VRLAISLLEIARRHVAQRARSPKGPLPDRQRKTAEPGQPTGQINCSKAMLNTLAMTYGDRLGINQARPQRKVGQLPRGNQLARDYVSVFR